MAGNVAHSARNPAYNRPPGLRSVRWSVERVDRGMDARLGLVPRQAGRDHVAKANGDGAGVLHEAVARPSTPRVQRNRPEIGRASVRGRVCQYGEISVVAGTLKKK